MTPSLKGEKFGLTDVYGLILDSPRQQTGTALHLFHNLGMSKIAHSVGMVRNVKCSVKLQERKPKSFQLFFFCKV